MKVRKLKKIIGNKMKPILKRTKKLSMKNKQYKRIKLRRKKFSFCNSETVCGTFKIEVSIYNKELIFLGLHWKESYKHTNEKTELDSMYEQ